MKLFFLSLLTSCLVWGQAWDRFRGPNGTGVSDTTGLPSEFGPGKNLLWKTVLPPGHSSPVLYGGRIFLTAFRGEDLLTLAIDRKTGRIDWQQSIKRVRTEKFDNRNNAASASAAADASGVYVFFPEAGLVSYSLEGKERWRTPIGPFSNMYGMGSSPVIAGNLVVLVCDQLNGSFAAAFSKADGRMRWKVPRQEALSGHSTPVLFTPAGGKPQIIAPGSFRMDAYDAETGETVWFSNGLASEMKSVPVVGKAGGEDVVFINGFNMPENDPGKQVRIPSFSEALQQYDADKSGTISLKELEKEPRMKFLFSGLDRNGDGQLDEGDWKIYQASMEALNGLLAIRPTGKGDVTVSGLKWKYHRAIPQLPSTLLYRDVLYMITDSGVLSTFDPATGNLYKQARLRGAADKYFASPVAADGKIFFVSLGAVVTVLEAGPEQKVLAVNDLDDETEATPAIEDGCLYIRTKGGLYAFGASRTK